MYIKFSESPTGKFGLAYSAGETGFVEDELGKEVLKAGYGERVAAPKEAANGESENRKVDNTDKEKR